MAYSFVPCEEYFQTMAEFQSTIDQELEKKACALREVDSLILSKFMEFQKQNQELRQQRRSIQILADSRIHNIQYEMDLQERAREEVLINERLQDIHEECIDAEFEDVPTFSVEKRAKKVAKASKKSVDKKSANKKLVLNVINSNSKTTDKLPRFIIQQTLYRRTKPKYKNLGL